MPRRKATREGERYVSIVDTIPIARNKREIGREVACWRLSSAKPGNGVAQLRDGNVDTYWQSDGIQPHLISIQFQKRRAVCDIAFYLDYKLDESYTPKTISILCGTTAHDLREVRTVDLEEPNGWVVISLADTDEGGGDHRAQAGGAQQYLRAHFVQVMIKSMHQNGRDTHVRISLERITSH